MPPSLRTPQEPSPRRLRVCSRALDARALCGEAAAGRSLTAFRPERRQPRQRGRLEAPARRPRRLQCEGRTSCASITQLAGILIVSCLTQSEFIHIIE